MKKHFLPFLVLMLLATALVLASCGESYTYCTVKFDLAGGNTEQPLHNLAIEEGKKIVEPTEPTREGYNFIGWYIGNEKWNFAINTVSGDITLKARWERITHTVTFDSAGGSSVEPQTVGHGDCVIEPTAPEKTDSQLIGWYLGDVEWNFATDTVDEDITLVAHWDTAVIVSFETQSHCVRETQIHEVGDKVTRPHNPTREGYRFLGWHVADELWNFDTPLETSIVLTAKWESCETYEITFDVNGGTPIETMYVPVGEYIERPPSPTKKSCELLCWEYFIPETEDMLPWYFSDMIPEGDMTLVAIWSLPIHRP